MPGLVLRGVALTDGRTVDVRTEGASIAAVGPALDPRPGDDELELSGHLLVPAPVEPHAHLDKALLAERIDNPTGDLLGAILAMEAHRDLLTVDDVARRAERAARRMVANGVTAIRTHADTTTTSGLTSVEGLLRAREALAGVVELQIVALLGWPVTGRTGAGHRALGAEAVAMGADLLGGCPHLEDDPDAATAVILDLAAGLGVGVDLHTDETLNPSTLSVRSLVRRVRAGFAHEATASHCVSLGVQDEVTQRLVAAELAEAGVAVVTLPQTNLYLMGRDRPVETPRGLTALAALLAAGVTVAAGADNLQDPFNLVGRADPLETAALLVMAGHLSPGAAWQAVGPAGRAALNLPAVDICPGAPAELLALPATGIRQAVADAPPARVVVHRGRVVSRTTCVTTPGSTA